MIDEHAIEALCAGQKIKAIKIIREKHSIGLKEAKQRVDDYIKEHPEYAPSAEPGLGKVLMMGLGVLLIFAIYKVFAG